MSTTKGFEYLKGVRVLYLKGLSTLKGCTSEGLEYRLKGDSGLRWEEGGRITLGGIGVLWEWEGGGGGWTTVCNSCNPHQVL